MLNLAVVDATAEAVAYYLDRQAGCRLDYYTGSGEAWGTWTGKGAARLGLHGRTNEDALRRVLAGLSPGRPPAAGPARVARRPARPAARRAPGRRHR